MLEPVIAAINDAISDNPNGVPDKIIALQMGVGRSTLHKWGEHDAPPLGRLVQFVNITGALGPLHAVARLCGCAVVPLPPTTADENEAAAIGVIQETADLLKKHAASLADGKITEEEYRQIEREADELVAAVVRLKAAARAKVTA